MELASLIENYREAFETRYAGALEAISRCRTPAAGQGAHPPQ